jgi:hypothetical protein
MPRKYNPGKSLVRIDRVAVVCGITASNALYICVLRRLVHRKSARTLRRRARQHKHVRRRLDRKRASTDSTSHPRQSVWFPGSPSLAPSTHPQKHTGDLPHWFEPSSCAHALSKPTGQIRIRGAQICNCDSTPTEARGIAPRGSTLFISLTPRSARYLRGIAHRIK